MSYFWHGFHRRRIPWGFNADHQPVGGRFDAIEDALVAGSLFASYITFDLSPELAASGGGREVSPAILKELMARLAALGLGAPEEEVRRTAALLSPAMEKLQRRHAKYGAIREKYFSSARARRFYAELSIDELPGLTTPVTLALALALAEQLGIRFEYVAPNIGFQKNTPFADNALLEQRVGELSQVAQRFGCGFGFHSGSGKSFENYATAARTTGRRLEIKTSGRYTYEMGRALANSSDASDRQLWNEWYAFTTELAVTGAFSEHPDRRRLAREFLCRSLGLGTGETGPFSGPGDLRRALGGLAPSPDHMHWFEYNFLFVLGPNPDRLGDHGPEGYRQRARFYRISDDARLRYAKNVADYILFLAEATDALEKGRADALRRKLAGYATYAEMLRDI